MLHFNFVFSILVPRMSERVPKKKKVSKDTLNLADAPPSTTGALEGASIVDLTVKTAEPPTAGALIVVGGEPVVSSSSDAAPSIT